MLSWAKPGGAEGIYMSQGGEGVPSFPALLFTNTGDADVASYHACRLRKKPRRNRQRKVVTEWPFAEEKAKEK